MKTFTTPEIVSLNIEETANGRFSFTPEGQNGALDFFEWFCWDNHNGPAQPQPGDNKGDEKGDTTPDGMSN